MFVRRHHEKKNTLEYFFGAIKRHTIKSALETVPVPDRTLFSCPLSA